MAGMADQVPAPRQSQVTTMVGAEDLAKEVAPAAKVRAVQMTTKAAIR